MAGQCKTCYYRGECKVDLTAKEECISNDYSMYEEDDEADEDDE